ncbi:MAG: transcriptional regulator [Proteobacteria bacterium SG_bin6]|nr:MAG: transcriptional regulator [Proteobacteria bacterium SG_bin6]
MSAQKRLVAAALTLLETTGEQGFSTRAACDLAGVKAPTLYHYFGNADGLLSAALEEAFRQFLARKQALIVSDHPAVALMEGWDDYVAFAAERPRLYGAMIARVLQGACLPAAVEARAHLVHRLEAIAALGRLRLPPHDAADLVWGSAHAAAMLFAASARAPSAAVIAALRDGTRRAVLIEQEGDPL